MKADVHSEAAMLEVFRKDARRGISLIFHHYYAALCKTAYTILPDAALSEDLAQEVLLELWRRRDDFHIQHSLGAYLRRSVVNRTLNYIRDKRLNFEQELTESVVPEADTGIAVESAELAEVIDQAIDRLPEQCRLVFVLSRFEDMSHKEIAAQLGIAPKTVENHIAKALRLLRIYLGPYLSIILLFHLLS